MKDNKVWFAEYTAGVPETINPDAFDSLPHLFDHYAEVFSDRPVFTSFGVSMTYHHMKDQVNNFAAFLQKQLKLKKGDRIAVMMPNLLQYPVSIFGALKAGLIVVNVNPLYTAPELAFQLKDSSAETIVVMENFADRLEIALPNTPIKNIIIVKVGDMLGMIKGNFYNFVSRYIKNSIPRYVLNNAISFKRALAIGEKYVCDYVGLKNTDEAFLQYTGGTTGRSKGAILTHRNIIANVLQCVSWIRGVKAQQCGVMLGALPMYHIFSLTVCGMCIFPMGASTLLIANPRDTAYLIKAIKHASITMIIGLNTLFNAMLNHRSFASIDFSTLKLTISGGMAMQKAVADRWQQVTGVPVLEGYGLTESSPVITLCPISKTYFTGSVGLPIPSTEVTIRDDSRQDLFFHKIGEIWARGPQVMKGYWHAEEETNNVIDQQGWLRTGDIGYMDEHGYVFIVDRKKDMVLVSGFNVFPNEVEAVIASHPGVQTVAVIGVPNEKTGEALKAFIIKKDPNLTRETLIAFCRKSLTGYKIPHFIEFRDTLPMSTVGKVLRRELREETMKV
ncbi:MAG: long-chain-fatty-acid--CoA ligase [Gammaproteobacteria bacterium RIFCSPHIGHO2_02_FULL_39_13]|nr:MAG: long-chain-fatty-acid--CoA ligase [Gammaproteobacteria bacterium RIFCSPHIGHO2_02_FULL_39_13]OGT50460.1 MAG: long-chain-fatty-acid--CoA ligase [Gammaproteobacteria bacterium RIFCSPHIGHO2_12_FULL_39_24]